MPKFNKSELASKLNPVELEFIHYVIEGDSYTQAYMKTHPTCSYNTAGNSGSKYMKNPDVQNYYNLLQIEMLAKYDITANELVRYHLKIIRAYEKLLDLLEKPDKTQADRDNIRDYKGFLGGADYKAALEHIGRLKGLYIEKYDVNDTRQVIKLITSKDVEPLLIESEDIQPIQLQADNINPITINPGIDDILNPGKNENTTN